MRRSALDGFVLLALSQRLPAQQAWRVEAFSFATIQSAQYLGMGAQLGSVEIGKLADLVILDGDPLADIRNSRRIDRVMLNGVLYSGRDASRLYPDPQPARPMYFQR
jgi:imidazolonepropionase-like amidohydrolase